jgi:mannosyl-oligosaccharide alpha-1,3-glucosidase
MYGVWDEAKFPHPESMLEGLDAKGRKLVIILDPHLKRSTDFFLYNEAQDKNVLVKSPDGKSEYEGWCWSGSSSWIDMFHPASWKWWQDVYKLSKNKLKANARNLHIWNDMNEPSVFNGPEITCPKDVIHYGGWENRDLHNINGVLFHNNTAKGLEQRESPARRSFVLSRSFWAGSQRFGAVWTGDNLGDWEHLAVSVPMMLADSIGGMSFVGSDVGGFFGNPSSDMLVRWYQSGIFMPFFRAHAHIDTKRREPYLLEEPLRSAVRDLIKLRYKHLPLWYTAFKESAATGQPVIRPQYMMFPADAKGFAVDDQYYIGDSGLLVKPPVSEKGTSVDIYLAEDQPYYHYFTHDIYYGSANGKHVTVAAPLDETVPLLHRGGSIMPLRERVRRSAELGWRDPVTLIIALNKPTSSSGDSERATGVLYLDDGQTFDFEKGSFIWRRFTWTSKADGSHVLSSEDESARRSSDKTSILPASGSKNTFAQAIKDVRVERVVVLGLDKEPKSIKAGGKSVDFSWSAGTSAAGSKLSLTAAKASELIIRDPKVLISEDFSVEIA